MIDRSNQVYVAFNALGVGVAYFMLTLSIWLTDVPLATKGFWGMGVFMLTLVLVNLVKYRMDDRAGSERLARIEAAKTDKLLQEYGSDPA